MTVVAGLLLAAGAGRRLGMPKALVELEGRTLVERGVALLKDGGCAPVLVVLGAAAEQVSLLLTDVEIVIAEDWDEGMAASLRAGLAVLDDLGVEACIIALVDQPLVGAEAVRRLAALAGQADAAVATYGGQPRNPVLLDRAVWPELLSLTGDMGARSWLRSHPQRVRHVPCDDTGSPDDVDEPADLDAVRALLSP